MASLLTINRHRLYDIWTAGLEDIRNPQQSSQLGSRIIANSISHPNAQSLTARAIVLLVGVVAGVVVSLCNTALAFALWSMVKAWSLASDFFFPDRAALDTLDKVALFLTADGLEMRERIAFLNLQTRSTIAEYLREMDPPERLQELLRYVEGRSERLSERWEDALYEAGLKVKKLTLDHGHALRHSLPDLVRLFPLLQDLTIDDRSFTPISITDISKFTALQHLKVGKFRRHPVPASTLINCLSNLKHLKTIEYPTGDMSAQDFERLVTACPSLTSITFTCMHDMLILPQHIAALKKLPSLTHLSFSGNFRWNPGALQAIGELTSLTSLKLDPLASTPAVTAEETRALANLTQLESLSLAHLPIDDHTLTALQQRAPNLQTLNLTECSSFTRLGKAPFTKLTSLTVMNCKEFGDDGVRGIGALATLTMLHLEMDVSLMVEDEALHGLQNLRELEHCALIRTNIATNALQNITQNCKKLHTLTLDWSIYVTDRDLRLLQALPHLKRLSLGDCSFLTNDAMQEIAKLSSLTNFSCLETSIDSASFVHLRDNSSLESLQISEVREPWPAEHIVNLPPQLREIHLNHRGNPNLEAVAAACPNITTLRIHTLNSHNDLVNEVASKFDALSKFRFLETLEIEKNDFFIAWSETMAQGFRTLAENPRLKKITLNHMQYATLYIRSLAPPACVTMA